MNTKRILTVMVMLLGLLLGRDALAFYNPQTGRWLNRDPYMEAGFDLSRGRTHRQIGPVNLVVERGNPNLFAFLRNVPLSDFDLLGLCDGQNCNCGKDTTMLVYRTLGDIADRYIAAPWIQKIWAQLTMFGPTATWSWDIRYLFNYEDPQNPCKECRNAVTFENKCVHANELNYIMWGYAMFLCDMDEPELRLAELEFALEVRGKATGEPLDWNFASQPSHARCQQETDLALGQLLGYEHFKSSPTSDLTSKRLARLVALSRFTKSVVGGSFALNTRIAFGHGCDCPGYDAPVFSVLRDGQG